APSCLRLLHSGLSRPLRPCENENDVFALLPSAERRQRGASAPSVPGAPAAKAADQGLAGQRRSDDAPRMGLLLLARQCEDEPERAKSHGPAGTMKCAWQTCRALHRLSW